MTGEVGAHSNRPELVADHGYDTKFAMHAMRLGYQGVELLTTGRITLPVPQPALEHLRAVRRGAIPLPKVIAAISDLERQLQQLQHRPTVREVPDHTWVDAWLHRSYLAFWKRL